VGKANGAGVARGSTSGDLEGIEDWEGLGDGGEGKLKGSGVTNRSTSGAGVGRLVG